MAALEDTNSENFPPGLTLAGLVYPATSSGFGWTVTAQSSVPGLPGSLSSDGGSSAEPAAAATLGALSVEPDWPRVTRQISTLPTTTPQTSSNVSTTRPSRVMRTAERELISDPLAEDSPLRGSPKDRPRQRQPGNSIRLHLNVSLPTVSSSRARGWLATRSAIVTSTSVMGLFTVECALSTTRPAAA